MTTKPTDKPQWAYGATEPDDVSEPPASKKSQGWVSGERPPHEWINWLQRAFSRWIDFLDLAFPIKEEDIQDGAVTTPKIADRAVTGLKIGLSEVDTENLNDNAVTTPKIAFEAVTYDKIADQAVGTVKIANDAVTVLKIANGAVEQAKIKDGAVSTAKIQDQAITTAKIADLNVTTAKLAAAAIIEPKIAKTVATFSGSILAGADVYLSQDFSKSVNSKIVWPTLEWGGTPAIAGAWLKLNLNIQDINASTFRVWAWIKNESAYDLTYTLTLTALRKA